MRPSTPGFPAHPRCTGARAPLRRRRSAPASRGLWASPEPGRPAPPRPPRRYPPACRVQGCSHAGRRKPGTCDLRGARPPPTAAPVCGPGPARRRRHRCARARASTLQEARRRHRAPTIPGLRVPIGLHEIVQMHQPRHTAPENTSGKAKKIQNLEKRNNINDNETYK